MFVGRGEDQFRVWWVSVEVGFEVEVELEVEFEFEAEKEEKFVVSIEDASGRSVRIILSILKKH